MHVFCKESIETEQPLLERTGLTSEEEEVCEVV